MSSNPYQPPQTDFSQRAEWGRSHQLAAQQRVSAPAIGLMVVSLLSIGSLVLSLGFDVFLLASGLAAEIETHGIDPTFRVVVRMCWGLAILAASSYSLWGAIQMKQLRNYQQARSAAIVAAIPCLGPCCLLGIPFGIWSLNVLSAPDVQSAFES